MVAYRYIYKLVVVMGTHKLLHLNIFHVVGSLSNLASMTGARVKLLLLSLIELGLNKWFKTYIQIKYVTY